MRHSKQIFAMLLMAICLMGILPLTVYANNKVYIQQFPQRYSITHGYPIDKFFNREAKRFEVSLSTIGSALNFKTGYFIDQVEDIYVPTSEFPIDIRLGAYNYDQVIISDYAVVLVDTNARVSIVDEISDVVVIGLGELAVTIPKNQDALNLYLPNSAIGVITNSVILEIDVNFVYEGESSVLKARFTVPMESIDYLWYIPDGHANELLDIESDYAYWFMRFFGPTQKTVYVTCGYTDIYNVVHRYIAQLNEIEWIRILSSIVLSTSVILGIVLLIKNIFLNRR